MIYRLLLRLLSNKKAMEMWVIYLLIALVVLAVGTFIALKMYNGSISVPGLT